MPSLQSSTGIETAKNAFRSFNLTLPPIPTHGGNLHTNVKTGAMSMSNQESQGRALGYSPSATGSQGGSQSPQPTATPLPFPPALFRAASNNASDVDNQRTMHNTYETLINELFKAIESGFNVYRSQAMFTGIKINGPFASGGRLVGPALDGHIVRAAQVSGWSGWEAKVRDATAKGIAQQWRLYTDSISVPHLPWYPAFAAIPSPTAPPTPNMPSPFAALRGNIGLLSSDNLKTAMRGALSGSMDFADQFFAAIGIGFNKIIGVWAATQFILNVLGQGPVPAFAPPYVPVGPVVGGDNIAVPGHIAS